MTQEQQLELELVLVEPEPDKLEEVKKKISYEDLDKKCDIILEKIKKRKAK